MVFYRLGGEELKVVGYSLLAHERCRVSNLVVYYAMVETESAEVFYAICHDPRDGFTEYDTNAVACWSREPSVN